MPFNLPKMLKNWLNKIDPDRGYMGFNSSLTIRITPMASGLRLYNRTFN